jgi:tyrosinase
MATRKNAATLTAAERQAFVNAVKQLKAAPSKFAPPTTGRYDDYVYVHMQAMLDLSINDSTQPVANGNWTATSSMRMPMWAHRCPAFLPWHRELLYQFERDLQAVSGDSSLAIPYWDWSSDQSPTGAPWLDDLMGGDGGDGPVTTGPFAGAANWKLNLSEDQVDHLVRGFGRFDQDGATFPRLPTAAEVNATLGDDTYDAAPWNDTGSLASFRNHLEGWYVPPGSDVQDGMHNLVHLWVGGNNGTMLPSTSPNDPVFFLHHCNIDRLWAVWQQQHPSAARYLPSSPLPSDPGQGLNEPMIFFDPGLSSTPPWSDPPATPSKLMDHHGLGYRYDYEPTGPPVPLTRALVSPAMRRLALRARDRFRLRLEDIR